jgi:hypothetical protein
MPKFESTKKKIELTDRQISDLETGIAAYLQASPCTWESSVDPDHGILSFTARNPGQMPLELTLLLGEVISNLRSVLDYATSDLISIDTGIDDLKLIFPIAVKQADYIALCRNIKTRRDDTKAFFMTLAAYPGGAGKILYSLDHLENTGKQTVLMPMLGVAKIGPIRVLKTDGSVASTAASMECSMDIDGRTHLMNLGAGMSAEIDKNAQPTFDLFFGDVGDFKFQRIVPTLKMLATAVKGTAQRIERFMGTRF